MEPRNDMDALPAKNCLPFREVQKVGSVTFALSPDGTMFATAGDDKLAHIWDATTGEELLTLRGHSEWIVKVAFNPNGTRLATFSADGILKVWDLTTTKELLSLQEESDGFMFMWAAFSPDGF